MSLLRKICLVAGLFFLFIAQSFATEIQRQTIFTSADVDAYSLTSSNHLWFQANNKFMETEFVNGQWVNRRFVVPEGSELESKFIYDFAVTDQHLWMIEADKVTAFELSESAPFIKNKVELPLAYAVGEHVDMTVALDNSGVVSHGRNQYVTAVWVFTLDNGQIKQQELEPPSCRSPGGFLMTSQWLVLACGSYENVVYRKNGLHYELFKTIYGQVLHLNPENSALIVYHPDLSKIVTLALPSLNEISSISLVTEVYQSSRDSLFLVDKVENQDPTATRQVIRLDNNGQIVEQLKFSSFDKALGLASYKNFSAFLHKVGDSIFLGFDEWVKNEESGLYDFRGNTWQHKLGVSHSVAESFPKVNAVVFGGFTKQIWLGEPSEMPVVRGYAQLITTEFQQVNISATANHEYSWWFAGIRYNTLYLGLWTPEHQFRQIEVAYPHGFSSSIYDMYYFKDQDTLLIHTQDGIFMQCSNVSNLETSGCQPIPLPENMQYKVATKHGLLVYQKAASESALTASMFTLTSAGLQQSWSLSLNEEQSKVVPHVYVEEHDVVLGRKAQIRLSDGAGTFVDTPSGPSFYGNCLFLGQTDILCPSNAFEFFRFNESFTIAMAIRPGQDSSLVNLGGALRHATQNGYVLTSSKDQIVWHRLDLPQINFTNKDILVDAFQDENIILDLNNHLTSLNGLVVNAEETANAHLFSLRFLQLKTGDASWQLNTSNDLALYNPKFNLNFTFSNDLWNMNLPYEFSLHNINDAPRVKPGERVNDLDIGDTYMLDFFEVFEDIDRDTLSFQMSTLPAGFIREDTRIMATPTSPGRYSFSITATDPSGLSVSATFSGMIKGKGSNDSGGGSVGYWVLLCLSVLVWIRRSTARFWTL
ncbi:hypothetical protein Rhein_0636 [Rheinheimera sp. A13L]|uniref:Ig domain-containing protein n=1 Tax=Rheinheimera sp. A13L TaxID=506534 RepID=UPI0002124F95|nr:Ig domain-containing protein [Rheinheimera sp. A13L]EGM79248.1 hypothetical protein Rhein_0636 [Rheinheimera sp. A13L]